MTEPTPWSRLLAVALRFGVSPDRFWRLSLREWRAITATHETALTRSDFRALAHRFPDTSHG